jgi:hypothetical protein
MVIGVGNKLLVGGVEGREILASHLWKLQLPNWAGTTHATFVQGT